MTDLIRKAVELADGWELDGHLILTPSFFANGKDTPPEILDALAAQLVRQVDALPGNGMRFSSHRFGCILDVDGKPKNGVVVRGPDRTMNTIKAIVESGVLE